MSGARALLPSQVVAFAATYVPVVPGELEVQRAWSDPRQLAQLNQDGRQWFGYPETGALEAVWCVTPPAGPLEVSSATFRWLGNLPIVPRVLLPQGPFRIPATADRVGQLANLGAEEVMRQYELALTEAPAMPSNVDAYGEQPPAWVRDMWSEFITEHQLLMGASTDADLVQAETQSHLSRPGAAWFGVSGVGAGFCRPVRGDLHALEGVYVRHDHRHNGVAADLTRARLAHIYEAGGRRVMVAVYLRNQPSIAHVERHGFSHANSVYLIRR